MKINDKIRQNRHTGSVKIVDVEGSDKVETIKTIIVDDTEIIVKTLELYLKEIADIEIVGTASNGAEGYELYKEKKPELILTDMQMPIMTGIELIEKITKEDKENVKAVLITGESNPAIFTKAQQIGFNKIIKKPFSQEQIIEMVEEIKKPIEKEDEEIKVEQKVEKESWIKRLLKKQG